MATSYKVLGQVSPAATTWTTVYTVPAATQSVASTMSICNTNGSAVTVRLAVRPAGATLDPKHYIVYDPTIASKDTMFLTLGISLSATDVIDIYASSTGVSVNLFGSEIA